SRPAISSQEYSRIPQSGLIDFRTESHEYQPNKPREKTMPAIKITDIAYGRLRAPDLDVMEEFLTHFGLVNVERTNNALYMRGSDPAHHIHITEKGDPKFVGMAFYARNVEDLKKVSRLPGASGIEAMDEPGEGKRVRLTEPNGFQIEVVHGI